MASLDEVQRLWTLKEHFSDLSLFRDWDYNASSLISLRTYWDRYGTIPYWNFHFNGGRPDLSDPNVWTFCWPSLFGYFFPPYPALFIIWIVLSIIGFWSLSTLLRDWGVSRLAAMTAACLYVFSGYFASHFNQGHIDFAFYHLLPLIILLFHRLTDQCLEHRAKLSSILLLIGVSFAFFTSAIPHGVFHFYPVFLVFVIFKYFQSAAAHTPRRALQAVLCGAAAHAAGLMLASYKLLTVIFWQFKFPRSSVADEYYSLVDLFSYTQRLLPNYDDLMMGSESYSRYYGAWEVNNFVGPLPVIAVLAVIVWAVWDQRTGGRDDIRPNAPRDFLVWFPLVLLAAGLWLSMGNISAWTPGFYFRSLPLLRGIRVFPRYQILVLFAISLLSAFFMTLMEKVQVKMGCGKWILSAVALLMVLPSLAQTALLVWAINAVPNESLAEKIAILPKVTDQPILVNQFFNPPLPDRFKHSYLLRQGYWIGSSYEQLHISRPLIPAPFMTLTSPPILRVKDIFSNGIAFSIPEKRENQWVILNFPFYDHFSINMPLFQLTPDWFAIKLTPQSPSILEIRANLGRDLIGICMSVIACLGICLFVLGWWLFPFQKRIV